MENNETLSGTVAAVRYTGNEGFQILTVRDALGDPRALQQVSGIGFRIADTLALSLGFEPTHRDWISAGLRHVINARSASGHTPASEGAALPVDRVASVVALLLAHDKLQRVDGGLVGLPALLRAEQRVVLVGHRSAINRAARHVTGRRRQTSLPLWLRQPPATTTPHIPYQEGVA